MRGGSWTVMLAAGVLFLLAFAWQRQRSSFLAIEAMGGELAAIARPHGIDPAAACALRAMLGVAVTNESWQSTLAAFAGLRGTLGDELAAVAVFGDRTAAHAARAAAADAAAAWHGFRSRPEAEPGLRFVVLRDRFVARCSPGR